MGSLSQMFCNNTRSATMGQTPHGFKRLLLSHLLSKCSKNTFIHPSAEGSKIAESFSTYARSKQARTTGVPCAFQSTEVDQALLETELKQDNGILCALVPYYFLFARGSISVNSKLCLLLFSFTFGKEKTPVAKTYIAF